MLAVDEYPPMLRQAADFAESRCEPELADALREVADHVEALHREARELMAEFHRIAGRGGWTPQGGHVASRLRELLGSED
jgi:hypothetical protein